MKRTAAFLGGAAMFALLLISGCAGSTKLPSVWGDPTFEPNSLRRLMVMGVGKNVTDRRVFEDRFTAALRVKGADVQPSYPLFGDNLVDSASVSMKMHEEHCDAVFVTRIVDEKTVKTYYPPTSTYFRSTWPYYPAPAPYYGSWYNYYSRGYTTVTTPGYTVENQIVSFETNLYRVSDSKLVWSALSTTWLGQLDTPGTEIEPFVRQIVDALVDSRIIAKGKE